MPNSGAAYALSKRANHLRVQAAAVAWGDRGARVNSISPGIILTPLAKDEMSGPGAQGYQPMIAASAAGRVGTTDEVATAAAFLLGPDAAFVTGADLLIDGGVIAAIRAGRIQLSMQTPDHTKENHHEARHTSAPSTSAASAWARWACPPPTPGPAATTPNPSAPSTGPSTSASP